MILVSACLLGECCKYSGGNNRHTGVIQAVAGLECLPCCPEVLGGLPIPRAAAEIVGSGGGRAVWRGEARVLDRQGHDRSKAFCRGAEQTLLLCQTHGIQQAILKEGSPSCGSQRIYDGSFQGGRIAGQGVTAALLAEHGIIIKSEADFPSLPL